MSDTAVSYVVEDAVGVLTIDRPPVNAVRYQDVEGLGGLLASLPRNDELALVIETTGEVFMAGHDVNEFLDLEPSAHATGTDSYLQCCEALYDLPIPSIVAVDGPALGSGMVLTAFSDLRVAAPDSSFGLPEIDVGVVGGYGAIRRLLPDGVARYLFYTGETISGRRAHELGLVGLLDETPQGAAKACAQEIASKSPDAVRAAQQLAIEAQPRWPLEELRRERERSEALLQRPNAREAAQAFLEDRDPDYE